jgi:hypothetical protein
MSVKPGQPHGPETLEALGVDVPDDAPIVYLRAGAWHFDY